MTECREQRWLFQELGKRKVEVDFGGGYLSSDGGGLILRELERHSGLLRAFSDCFVDYRDPRYIEHSVQELVSQRIHGLVLGYEDLNDHDHLRLDPIHGLISWPGAKPMVCSTVLAWHVTTDLGSNSKQTLRALKPRSKRVNRRAPAAPLRSLNTRL